MPSSKTNQTCNLLIHKGDGMEANTVWYHPNAFILFRLAPKLQDCGRKYSLTNEFVGTANIDIQNFLVVKGRMGYGDPKKFTKIPGVRVTGTWFDVEPLKADVLEELREEYPKYPHYINNVNVRSLMT